MRFNLATTVSLASVAVTLAVAGMAARMERGPGGKHFRYAVLASLSGALFCLTDGLNAAELSVDLTVWSGRVNIVAAELHAASWVAFLAAWGKRPLTRVERAVLLVGLVVAATALVPGAAVGRTATDRVLGWAGVTYREPEVGPLAVPVLAFAYAAQVLAARAALRMSRRMSEARVVAGALILLCAIGVIDLFTAFHVTPLPYLMDPALATTCLSIGSVVATEAAESAARSVDLERARATLAEREELAALGQLAAVVAHEVRNPVAIIFGALASLRRAERSGDDAMLLGIVGDEAERLKKLVARLLDAVRPFDLQYSRHPVADVIRAAVSQVTASSDIAATEIELVELTSEEIECDEVLLEQAISNIVQNAVLADGRRTPVRIATRVGAEATPGMLEIEVMDDGEGVPADVQPRLFTPFFTTRATGTGLGLALVKRIASAHGGTVEHVTPPAGGASFILRVPLRPNVD